MHANDKPMIDALSKVRAIVVDLKRRARQQLECAERTADECGKKVMQHGGIVYANAALEIEEAIT